MRISRTLILSLILCLSGPILAAESVVSSWSQIGPSPADAVLAKYFLAETEKLSRQCLTDVQTLDEWKTQRVTYRRQLFEMLGLDPLPERTPLAPVITGRLEQDDFVVEKLHYQSRPGLYVTGNLYLPKHIDGKAPAILYVCGHGRVKKNGISYGNKVHYQHHGAWFARNGYVCLIIDSLQLGEIEGIHHGTYRYGMWWWNTLGYTPAGVEAWNCIRALDYLQSRKEVDPERIGVTGRSGGGAYSWWIAALDERIKVAVPVAGITTLKNHVVDGCVEGHCDCMFLVNTYRWDYPLVAALVAPRPLLISNSDKDRIFPLDGVMNVYTKARRIYRLYDQLDHIGLQISEGPHKDTQELRVAAFHWFNRFLKGEDPLIEKVAKPFFEPEELKVFDTLPEDQKNTSIQETFTATAPAPAVPTTVSEWDTMRAAWMTALKEKCFRGWPTNSEAAADPLDPKPVFNVCNNSVRLRAWDFTSQKPFRLRLFLAQPTSIRPDNLRAVVLNVLDDRAWTDFLSVIRVGFPGPFAKQHLPSANPAGYVTLTRLLSSKQCAQAYVAPRGIGLTAWNSDARKRTHIRRRFMLLGQTLDGMRVWDVRRAIQTLRQCLSLPNRSIEIQSWRPMAGVALYASLFEPEIKKLTLHQLPHSHRDGPIFLNVLRVLDLPQAVTMAAERSTVHLIQATDETDSWKFPQATIRALKWDKTRFQPSSAMSRNLVFPVNTSMRKRSMAP